MEQRGDLMIIHRIRVWIQQRSFDYENFFTQLPTRTEIKEQVAIDNPGDDSISWVADVQNEIARGNYHVDEVIVIENEGRS
jgi:hypothetical protein